MTVPAPASRWVLLAGLAVAGTAWSDDAGPLDPAEAVRLALAHSPDVAAAITAVDVARGQRDASRVALFNPQVNTAFTPDRSYIQLYAYQPLSISGEGWFARAAARHAVEGAQAALDRARFEAAAAARRAWADAATSIARHALAEQVAAHADRTIALVRARQAHGDASTLDVRLAELGRVQAEVGVLDTATADADALARLSALLGTSVTADAIPADPLRAAPLPSRDAPAERSDVAAARAALATAEAELSRARAAALPPVWVGLKYENHQGDVLLAPYLRVDVPLFDRNDVRRGAAAGRRGEAAARVDAVEARADVDRITARSRATRAEEALARLGGDVEAEAQAALDAITLGLESGEFEPQHALVLRDQVLAGMDAVIRLRRAVVQARLDLLLANEDPVLLGSEAP